MQLPMQLLPQPTASSSTLLHPALSGLNKSHVKVLQHACMAPGHLTTDEQTSQQACL